MPAQSELAELSLRRGRRYLQPLHGALGAPETVVLLPWTDASVSGLQPAAAVWA